MQQYVRIKFLAVFVAALFSFTQIQCDKKLKPHRQTQLKMGTYVSIAIFDQNRSQAEISYGMRQAFSAIDSIEASSSRHLLASELTKLNQEGGRMPVTVSPALYHIISASQEIAGKTNGLFDETIAPVLNLWQFGEARPRKPAPAEIDSTLYLVNYKNVEMDSPAVAFSVPGMKIDLGGIAKGSAIDAAAAALAKSQFHDFMIDAGGDLAIHSTKLTKGKIRVWIRHPRKSEDLFGYFFLNEAAVATSGDYEQYFEENGIRYCHIINPKTGYPDSDVMSVTVVAETAEIADAFATGVFVMGWEKGIEFASSHAELQVVILAKGQGKIKYWATDSIMEKIHIVDDALQ